MKSLFFRLSLCSLCIICLMADVFAQKNGKKSKNDNSYEITIFLEGIPDTVLYIGYYYADKTYSRDSVLVDKKHKGTFVLRGDDTLKRGVYIVAGQRKNKYLEFIVDSSLKFQVRAENIQPPYYDILNHLEFKNSPENDVFLSFQKQMVEYQRRANDLTRKYKAEMEKGDEADKKTLSKILDERGIQYDSMQIYIRWLVDTYPNHLFAKLQKMGLEIEVPEKPENADSTWQYRYYLNHFWDNVDLSDDALVYSPLFYPRLKRFYEKVIPSAIDSLIYYTDNFISKISSKEIFKYVVWYVTHKYERSRYVGQDAVFVHMVLDYYDKGLCPWVDETSLEAMVERAKQLDPILIGKRAPQLLMMDTSGVLRSSYEFNKKYTIMWFWDTDCSHCKSSTPVLIELYNRAKDSLDMEIFAICMSSDTAAWKSYVREKHLPWVNVGGNVANLNFVDVFDVHSTPMIYVLDEQKRIIVKKLGVEELEKFLRRYDAGEIKY